MLRNRSRESESDIFEISQSELESDILLPTPEPWLTVKYFEFCAIEQVLQVDEINNLFKEKKSLSAWKL